MVGDAEQYRELMELYRSYADGELVELSRKMADLTDTAQDVLKGELSRRGLKAAAAEEPVEARVLTEEDLADMRSYAELAPAECIFDFETERAASAAYYALTREGIEAIVVSPSGRPDDRGPRVVVKPNDAARAAEFLSGASADQLIDTQAEEMAPEFDLPRCPACGGEETVLDSVDPVNQWRCEDCGKTWLEEAVSAG
jgi:hypothetical protein